jgi:hypothetical protein
LVFLPVLLYPNQRYCNPGKDYADMEQLKIYFYSFSNCIDLFLLLFT